VLVRNEPDYLLSSVQWLTDGGQLTNSGSGILILGLAGVMNASFTLPMKFTRRWAWENTWFAWTIFALLFLPIIVTYATVPHLDTVYRSSAVSLILEVAGFGAGWGVAQVFFGLAVDAIGIALTFSIVLGTSAAVGTLIPLLRLHPERLSSAGGEGIFAGVGLIILGVSACAVAGRLRERALQLHSASAKNTTAGLVLAILCGFGASFVNFGLAFGAPLADSARLAGASQLNAPNPVWLLVMLAGAVPNLVYCLWLLKTKQSGHKFSSGGLSYWMLALLMAILWFGSTLLYGVSTVILGKWGTVLGWPLFMSLIVITASLLGLMTSEWKNSGTTPRLIQWAGVGLLIVAVFVLAVTSRSLT
jgi:L-rhamnose-H+ transport protein